ncbi:Glycosyl phosphatidyl inositol protein transamidase complex subunit [Microbotryomycetes sp. JL221]|nr:Glycosyl phosphatidyl inositol protein transamidase complex subunit [Microbotryomycetes sp. JL221]
MASLFVSKIRSTLQQRRQTRLSINVNNRDTYSSIRSSLLRRNKITSKLATYLPWLRTLLVLSGLVYLVALPAKPLGRRHYISENALQPAQVNTYWNWADVHVADLFADDVAAWTHDNLTSQQRATQMKQAFEKLGLPCATQTYSFTLGLGETVSGTNSYAIYQAPKTDGAESLVLSASWFSRDKDEKGRRRINTRGIATVLALANYLKKSSYWSKDIVFLLSDGYIDGTQAWLDAFHGYNQANLIAEPLQLSTGGIWAALNLDYPHHSFSHVGLYYEGTNGHLTNLDFVNSATSILKHTGIPVILHSDVPEESSGLTSYLPDFLTTFVKPQIIDTYIKSSKNLVRQLSICAQGRPQGPEGLFGKYRIDALTFFALPAEGPHGFHTLGRAVESTFRSLNNLLERFHQSFFLYIMTSTDTFVTVGNYLAAPILVGAGLTVSGLQLWSKVDSKTRRGSRDVGTASVVIAITHVVGAAMFVALASVDPTSYRWHKVVDSIALTIVMSPFSFVQLIRQFIPPPTRDLVNVLSSFNLLLAGLTLSIVATLNFGAAVVLSLLLPAPSLVGSYMPQHQRRWLRTFDRLLALSSPPVLWYLARSLGRIKGADQWARQIVADWHIAGNWSLPLCFIVVVPLLLQASIANQLL